MSSSRFISASSLLGSGPSFDAPLPSKVAAPVEAGNLIIDPTSHSASLNGSALTLSPRELALLYFLASNQSQVLTRETLLDRVCGRDSYVSPRTVDVHIRWLRKHVEEDPDVPVRLITVRGVGYKFVG